MISNLLAHDCTVSKVSLDEASSFFDFYHADGDTVLSHSSVAIGLFQNDELIAVAQFCAPQSDLDRRTYTVQLLKIAFKNGVPVSNGLSALVTRYKEIYHPSDIFAQHGVMTNAAEIFVDELDWCVEVADKNVVYAWFDEDITFYTYKITASDSEKYYYGVSHVKNANATVDECLHDGYWGSGGDKLQRWKNKHSRSLIKEVVSSHATKAKAYLEEKQLIGDKWATDKLCLNSVPGGRIIPPSRSVTIFSLKECSIHGEALHQGPTCFECTYEKWKNMTECIIHGMTYHHGESCRKCSRAKALTLSTCPIHGDCVFTGTQCLSCINQASVSKKDCSIHGLVTFQGDNCTACSADAKTHMDICSIHGETKHYSGTCCKCTSAKRVTRSECTIHGEVNFLDGKCANCTTEALVSIRTCTVHGDTKHQGDQCSKCSSSKTFGIKDCAIHGETKHNGNQCCACQVEAAVGMKECLTHGLTKHQGDKCSSCSNGKLISMRICATHGETKHRGSSCYKCAGTKKAGSTIVMKDCPFHGEAKHQGNACAKCRIEKRSHNQKHKDLAVTECQFCETVSGITNKG